MDNLIFLGGPHGSGKTTLAELLAKEVPEVISPELETRTPKFYSGSEEIDFFHRQALKHAQRAIENYEYRELAREKPDNIVLANRCVYDVLAYDQAYSEVGWITEEEKEILYNGFDFLLSSDLRDPNVVVLNPGFKICKRHLHKRWETGKKKFMEDDMDYLRVVCRAYESYRGRENVLYIDHEINFDSLEIRGISQWIEEIRGAVCLGADGF